MTKESIVSFIILKCLCLTSMKTAGMLATFLGTVERARISDRSYSGNCKEMF
jgi:hypothetical protein